jgi:hypothetical protein
VEALFVSAKGRKQRLLVVKAEVAVLQVRVVRTNTTNYAYNTLSHDDMS